MTILIVHKGHFFSLDFPLAFCYLIWFNFIWCFGFWFCIVSNKSESCVEIYSETNNKTSYHNDALTTTESQIIIAIQMLAASILIRALFGISISENGAMYIFISVNMLAHEHTPHTAVTTRYWIRAFYISLHYSVLWFFNAWCICLSIRIEQTAVYAFHLFGSVLSVHVVLECWIRIYTTLRICVPLFTVFRVSNP